MDIKVDYIVRHIGSKEVYEVLDVIGSMALCKSVSHPAAAPTAFKLVELEVLMDEETDAFNVLFRSDDESE